MTTIPAAVRFKPDSCLQTDEAEPAVFIVLEAPHLGVWRSRVEPSRIVKLPS